MFLPLFHDTVFKTHRFVHAEWKNDCGWDEKALLINGRSPTLITTTFFHKTQEEQHEKPASEPRPGPETSQIRSRIANTLLVHCLTVKLAPYSPELAYLNP
jgi:hypothetical protein